MEMGKCRNLDFFYDVIFHLDEGKMIKVNSLVLQARSEYFRSMLNPASGFLETVQTDKDRL
jgi:hypothetical protein